jgi:hypothetical protein
VGLPPTHEARRMSVAPGQGRANPRKPARRLRTGGRLRAEWAPRDGRNGPRGGAGRRVEAETVAEEALVAGWRPKRSRRRRWSAGGGRNGRGGGAGRLPSEAATGPEAGQDYGAAPPLAPPCAPPLAPAKPLEAPLPELDDRAVEGVRGKVELLLADGAAVEPHAGLRHEPAALGARDPERVRE